MYRLHMISHDISIYTCVHALIFTCMWVYVMLYGAMCTIDLYVYMCVYIFTYINMCTYT